MNAKPIIFSAPMVRALLAGRKTQTRRVCHLPASCMNRFDDKGTPGTFGAQLRASHLSDVLKMCPYGQPGQFLWVRESLRFTGKDPDSGEPAHLHYYSADHVEKYGIACPYSSPWLVEDGRLPARNVSSMRMPRWASRLTLEIAEVRVQRLQEISAADAWAEGIPCSPDVNPLHEFRDLWNSIHGAAGFTLNPWLWCLTFKVHRANVDQLRRAA